MIERHIHTFLARDKLVTIPNNIDDRHLATEANMTISDRHYSRKLYAKLNPAQKLGLKRKSTARRDRPNKICRKADIKAICCPRF